MFVVGLSGRIKSGKSTAAALLVEKLGFTEIALASLLKDFTANMLGIPREWCDDQERKRRRITAILREPVPGDFRFSGTDGEHVSLRWFLQRVGTEGGRKTFGEDFWIKMLFERAKRRGIKRLVIPDVRFHNEKRAIQRCEGNGDGNCLIRCNRADMRWQHDFVQDMPPVPGLCTYSYPHEGYTPCRLPEASHPTAWSDDPHPSETELPVRGLIYDRVVETDSAEKTAAAVCTAAVAIARRYGLGEADDAS